MASRRQGMLIIGLLIILISPFYHMLMQNQRTIQTSNSLIEHLMLAKETALNTQQVVSVCPYNPDTPGLCGDNWEDGWQTFINPDHNQFVDTEPLAIETHPAPGLIESTVPLVHYNAQGFPFPEQVHGTLSILYPGCAGKNHIVLTILLSGDIKKTHLPCPRITDKFL